MKKRLLKRALCGSGKRAFYLSTVFLTALAVLVFLLSSETKNSAVRVSAERNDHQEETGENRVRADVLGTALNLGSATSYTVFAKNGINNVNSAIEGRSLDALRDPQAAIRAEKDLERAFSAINQLPCRHLKSNLTGGRFEPGVYCAPSADLSEEIVLDAAGDTNGIFVFIIKGSLRAGGNLRMILANGAAAENVFFVSNETASIHAKTDFRGNILAKKSVEVGSRASVKGRIFSLEGGVNLNENNVGGGTGVLQICKQQQGEGLENRIFRFRVGDEFHDVQVGQCSSPIELPVGLVVIEELTNGTLTPSGTWSGGFRLLNINSPTPGALGSVNLPLRTANVFIREGNESNQTIVNFINQMAITATVEICKYPVAPTNPNTMPPSTIPINDQDVTGIFDFTIDVLPGSTFPVAVGQCSGPIQVEVPSSPGPEPRSATIRVTELSELGYTLESANTMPSDRFQNLTLDVGIGSMDDMSGFPNPRGGYVTATVVEGGTSNLTTVNFFNRSNPSRIKVCKIAGPGIPNGTRFRFEVRGLAPSGPGNRILPGVNVTRTIDVEAGPANEGGHCAFVDGGFIVGTNALVTEIGALDPIPNVSSENPRVSSSEKLLTGSFLSYEQKVSSNVSEILRQTPTVTQKSNAIVSFDPFITETGQVSLSIDGLGTNAPSGIVQVQKPSGATVRRAFLMAATIPNGTTLNNTDITINGSPVTFTQTVSNTLSTPPLNGIVNNYLGEVTSIVKPTIDAAPAGRIDLNVAENPAKTDFIDGVILAVIFDDPTQTVSNTIALLFGALNPNNGDFAIGLANPINTNAPNFALNMSLGISYGFQGTDQFSTVDVGTNTRPLTRLTSSAGGQDDGEAANGALITVGGLDDDISNPANPNSPPNGDPRADDELYNLVPFVSDGDTTVNVRTSNPSNNDNIFFAAFFIGNNTAVIGEGITLTPISATNPVGTSHTVTALVQNSAGQPVANRQVRFSVLTGPNAGNGGSSNTDSNGRASFTYTGSKNTGTDTIQACFTNAADQEICSNIVSKTWIQPDENIFLTPTTATNPVGTPHTVTATLQTTGGQPIADRQVRFSILTGPNAGLTDTANTSSDGRANFSYTSNGETGIDTIRACFTNIVNQQICSNIVEKIWITETMPAPPVSRIRSSCGTAPGGTSVQGIVVNPNPNVNSKQVILPVRQGFCEVEYVNFVLRPTLLKICKIAGEGVPVGTPFTFDITISDDGGLFPDLTVPPLTVQAGPASIGGFCKFAHGPYEPRTTNPTVGTFHAGSTVTVKERAVPGVSVVSITSPNGIPVVNLPNRSAIFSLGLPASGANELVFTNEGNGSAPPENTLFDFDGDRLADVSIYRNGTWIWLRSSDGQTQMNDFGIASDRIVPADYDGDGVTDIAVYREGLWFILQSSDGQFRSQQFGTGGDIPTLGDFDGDGKDDPAVFRPSNDVWYILQSRDGFTSVQFGTNGDKPVSGDFDGDGRQDPAVFRSSDGTWYVLQSGKGFSAVRFGLAADVIAPADYDGDGKTDPAVYRDGTWYLLRSTEGFTAVRFGLADDRAVPADYDGDGRADVAVFRNGIWHILRSSFPPEQQYMTAQLGNAEDFPIPSSNVR
jgi:Bacterial Ig-like domain (group 1)./Protein of unknown function (DUF3494).